MLHTVTFRTLAVAACGWLLACDAAALTLGRARGAVLVGRPLELAIPATLDTAGEEPCASAEVFYGETRLARPPSVRWEPGAGGQGLLRVTSELPVDEPMVTVYLRVGCGGQTSTRRFVLLSEVPPDNEQSTATNRARVQPPLVAAAPAGPQAAAPNGRASAPSSRATAPRSTSPRRDAARAPAAPPDAAAPQTLRAEGAAPVARQQGRATAPSPAPRARREAAQVQSRPRLKLEPLDLAIDRDPTLRITTELSTQLLTDPRQRAAAAALWQVLQRGPEVSVQEALRLQGAERELNSLRDVTQQNAAAVTQLRAQVEYASSRRNTAALLAVGLALALAALLGWLAWRWQRARQMARVGRWFEANGSVQGPLPDTQPLPMPPKETTFAAGALTPNAAAVAAGMAAKQRTQAPATAPVPAVAASAARAGAASTWAAPEEFQASRGGSVRMVGVQEVIDIHDKADFFLSIGEPEQAIAALEAHVHDQVETSALAWMDLLDLYHSLGKRAEYERLRGEFRQRFAAQVPDFENFDQPTASLENYSRALSRIVALWPSRRVLDVIEESIFRKPGVAGAEPFSLEAYRELVLLYNVAKDVSPEQADASRSGPLSGFQETSLQGLNALDLPESTSADRDRLLIPPSSPRLGVDIDLDDEAPDSARAGLTPLDFDVTGSDELEPRAKRR
jgi:hypothetical protein